MVQDLFRRPSIGGSEGLVPGGEDERVWVGVGVLFYWRLLVSGDGKEKGWERRKGTYCCDLS